MRETVNVKNLLDQALLQAARDNDRVVLISTDSGKNTGFVQFIKENPDKCYELGIMETAGIGVSAGMALGGLIPVFAAPAPFVTARPFEFLKIDMGYMHTNVKLIGRNCGFNYADLGPTHHGLEDYALARMVPEMVVLAPTDATELQAAFKAMIEYEGPVYLRLGGAPLPKLYPEEAFTIGKGRVIREGRDVAIFCTGEIMVNVFDAVERLVAEGLDPYVVGLPTLYPLDEACILEAARRTGRVVTVEEHFEKGGLGTMVAETCARGCPVPIKTIAVPHRCISAAPYKDLIRRCGLAPDQIAESVKAFLN